MEGLNISDREKGEKENAKQENVDQNTGRNASQNATPSRAHKRRNKLLKVFGITALALLIVSYVTLCGVAASASDRVLPGVSLAGIELGGMTKPEVEQALTAAQEARGAEQDVYLVFDITNKEEIQTVRVPANYLALDIAASTERVWEEGQSKKSILLKGGEYLMALMGSQVVKPSYVDSGNLEMLLAEEIDGRIGVTVEESTAAFVDQDLELTRGTPGRSVDKENIKEQLFALLAEGQTVPVDGAAQFSVPVQETQPAPLDFAAIHAELCTEPQDASINKEIGEFKMNEVGLSFDTAVAESAFAALGPGESCRLPLIVTQPKVTMADLEQYLFNDLLGAATSQIGGSSNRLANVRLAASFCDGKILSPGEEFSYNGIVGRRTSARGFLPAPAYVGGQTVDEIGGGICQVSSTLYLTTLRANLGIVERHNHGYAVGYVPDGLDATVYYGSLDFRFKNTSPYPIRVVASVSDRTLNVSIYGTKTDGKTVEMKTEKISSKDYKTVYKIDNSVAPGKTKTSVTPYTGRTVKAYRCIYENGSLISDNLESTSVYKSRDKVVLVNSADAHKYGLAPAPTPAPTPQAAPAEVQE